MHSHEYVPRGTYDSLHLVSTRTNSQDVKIAYSRYAVPNIDVPDTFKCMCT